MRIVIFTLVLGCTVDGLELEGRECPCIDGWTCDESRNLCVRDEPSDAGLDDGGDAFVPDAGLDAAVDGGDDAGEDAGGNDGGVGDGGVGDGGLGDVGVDATPRPIPSVTISTCSSAMVSRTPT